MAELSAAEQTQRAEAALRHGAHSERKLAPVARKQKRRFLRQSELTVSELDGIANAYLDNWARAQAKVELMDAWAAEHGWLDPEWSPPAFTQTYFAALTAARQALVKLENYLAKRPPPSQRMQLVHIKVDPGLPIWKPDEEVA